MHTYTYKCTFVRTKMHTYIQMLTLTHTYTLANHMHVCAGMCPYSAACTLYFAMASGTQRHAPKAELAVVAYPCYTRLWQTMNWCEVVWHIFSDRIKASGTVNHR